MPVRFRIPPPPRLPDAVNYALAALLPVLALMVHRALGRWAAHTPFVPFFLVISVVSSMGGWGPGLLSVAASTACGWRILSGHVDPASALAGTAIFLPVAAMTAGLGAVVRAGFREREGAAVTLEQAVRLRDEFLSTASHELKTPLTSLSLSTQHLARAATPETGPEIQRRVASVRRQVDRLTALVDALLDVSRIRLGQLHLAVEDVDLAEVVREIADAFQGEAERTGSVIRLKVNGALHGSWDRLRLEQVLTNLLSNAVKYGAGHPIDVSLEQRDGQALLAVADQGIGIPVEDQQRIFDQFERGRSGDGHGGFGVGLWIVRTIVTALGGSVTVESAPRSGATFTVALPLSSRS